MSKKSKAQQKTKRAAEKRSKKNAMKATYATWRDQGITKGSKRQKSKSIEHKVVATKRGPSGKKPFPVHLWLDKSGNLKPGSPHKAWLELQKKA